MTALNPSAIAMGLFGFLFLFGGLALALRIALQSGGYGQTREDATGRDEGDR